MASAGSSSGVVHSERKWGIRVIKPIIYGNRATLLPQKNEKGHTHRWTCFVRAYDINEDLQHYIRKVQFRLHESYQNNVRIVEKHPYEITETGWGEFDIQIKLYFVDVNEKPVTIFHYLRLHHPVINLASGVKMVIKETYDEIVFNEPTELMYGALMKYPHIKKDPKFEKEKHDLKEKLETANRNIVAEIEDLKRTLKDGFEVVQKFRNQLQDGGGNFEGGETIKEEKSPK